MIDQCNGLLGWVFTALTDWGKTKHVGAPYAIGENRCFAGPAVQNQFVRLPELPAHANTPLVPDKAREGESVICRPIDDWI
jgi:hypothetical protein